MRQLILSGILAAAFAAPVFAAGTAKVAVDISLRDMSERFVDFYDTARKPAPVPAAAPAGTAQPAAPAESDADRRWRLFKAKYDFTSEADEASARAALEAAWPRYGDKIDQIVGGFDGVKGEWTPIYNAVFTSLYTGNDKPQAIRIVTYVGAFEGKVWAATEDDRLSVYIPLEVGADERDLPLARALVRSIMPRVAAWGAQPRNVAELVISEGVAAHIMQKAVPGKSVESYLDLTTEQLNEVKANRKAYFSKILSQMKDTSPAELASYSGPNLAQARYAGWMLVEELLKSVATTDLIHQRSSDLVGGSMKTLAKVNRAS